MIVRGPRKGRVTVSSDHGGQVPIHRRHMPVGRHFVSIGGRGVLHASRGGVVNYKKSRVPAPSSPTSGAHTAKVLWRKLVPCTP